MNAAKLLNEIVLPRLLEHEGFKKALLDTVSEIPITELQSIRRELPRGTPLTIRTLPEASNNVLANTIVEMEVTLKDAVEEAYRRAREPMKAVNEEQTRNCLYCGRPTRLIQVDENTTFQVEIMPKDWDGKHETLVVYYQAHPPNCDSGGI